MTSKNTDLHRLLSEKGAKWLKRINSQNGHGCNFVMIEGGNYGEIADAIGFKHSGADAGSVVIEVKVSRADFLRDKKKNHRIDTASAMGDWRYYLCPEGLISVDELPEQWGLIYASNKGRLRVVHGAAIATKGWKEQQENFLKFKFNAKNHMREQVLLIKSITRFKDIEDMIALQRLYNKSQQSLEEAKTELRKQNSANSNLGFRNTQLIESLLLCEFKLSQLSNSTPSKERLVDYRFWGYEDILNCYEYNLLLNKNAKIEKISHSNEFLDYVKSILNLLEEDRVEQTIHRCKMHYRKIIFTANVVRFFLDKMKSHFTQKELFDLGVAPDDFENLLKYNVITSIEESDQFKLTDNFINKFLA